MELDEFKDLMFDLLNENDNTMILDIDTNEKEDTFDVTMVGGDVFEIEFRKLQK